jgi:hypothetical protein
MSEDRLSQAMARIEQACARMEAAIATSGPAGEADPARVAQLEARHARLRAQVGEAIGELDQLLGEGAAR